MAAIWSKDILIGLKPKSSEFISLLIRSTRGNIKYFYGLFGLLESSLFMHPIKVLSFCSNQIMIDTISIVKKIVYRPRKKSSIYLCAVTKLFYEKVNKIYIDSSNIPGVHVFSATHACNLTTDIFIYLDCFHG